MSERSKDFKFFFEGAQQFCDQLGLTNDLVLRIYNLDSDWAFILQIDALVNAGAKVHHVPV